MDKILGVVGSVPSWSSQHDDDFADRLNYKLTTSILILFALLTSLTQYVGDRINCWVPAHFTGNHEEYANNYCWIRNTYYLPYDDYIPKEGEFKHTIPYYQWVPLILLVQALLFYLPSSLWRTFNGRSGIDVGSVVGSGVTFQNLEKVEAKGKTLEHMTKQMDRYLTSLTKSNTKCTLSLKHCLSCCGCCGRERGNYLVVWYFIIKILYVGNVIGQIFLLNKILGTDFHMYGIDVMKAMVRGEDWAASPQFPRVTMCDFKVRRLGNIQRYTVQCVLPINLFNEKIYLVIWFWFVFVAALTCFSLLSWIVRTLFKTDRYRYVKKHMSIMENKTGLYEKNKDLIPIFIDHYLKPDGSFILRLVGHNTNAITLTEFVNSLWKKWLKRQKKDSNSKTK